MKGRLYNISLISPMKKFTIKIKILISEYAKLFSKSWCIYVSFQALAPHICRAKFDTDQEVI